MNEQIIREIVREEIAMEKEAAAGTTAISLDEVSLANMLIPSIESRHKQSE